MIVGIFGRGLNPSVRQESVTALSPKGEPREECTKYARRRQPHEERDRRRRRKLVGEFRPLRDELRETLLCEIRSAIVATLS